MPQSLAGRRRSPIGSCSRWGLPCRSCHQERGALLPHHFTLTPVARGGLFSVALSCSSRRLAVNQHPALWSPDFPPVTPTCGDRRSPGLLRPLSRLARKSGARLTVLLCCWVAPPRRVCFASLSQTHSPSVPLDRLRSYMRSSMARFDISSAARFISRGTCTSFTRSNSLSSRSASTYSGRRLGDFTW
jgi:hypothetical protein